MTLTRKHGAPHRTPELHFRHLNRNWRHQNRSRVHLIDGGAKMSWSGANVEKIYLLWTNKQTISTIKPQHKLNLCINYFFPVANWRRLLLAVFYSWNYQSVIVRKSNNDNWKDSAKSRHSPPPVNVRLEVDAHQIWRRCTDLARPLIMWPVLYTVTCWCSTMSL